MWHRGIIRPILGGAEATPGNTLKKNCICVFDFQHDSAILPFVLSFSECKKHYWEKSLFLIGSIYELSEPMDIHGPKPTPIQLPKGLSQTRLIGHAL